MLTSLLRVGVAAAAVASIAANLFSTLLGIPLAWVVFWLLTIVPGAMFEFPRTERPNAEDASFRKRISKVILSAAWLPPYGGRDGNASWETSLACLVMLVPYFFASWVTERWVVAWVLEGIASNAVDEAVFKANAITYSLLAVYVGTLTVWQIAKARPELRYSIATVLAVGVEVLFAYWVAVRWS